MLLGNRVHSDIRTIVTSARHNTLRRGYYLGCVGLGNLGDDILQVAIYQLLQHKKSILLANADKGWLLRALNQWNWPRFEFVVIGGGTLIFEWDTRFLRLNDPVIKRRVAFGTGVADPEFWDYVDAQSGNARSTAPLRRAWVEGLNRFDYIGVRGEISKDILVRYGVEAPIRVLGDPALYFTKETILPKQGKKRIGVNVGRPDKDGEGFLWGRDLAGFLASFAGFLDLLIHDGWEVEFMPVWQPDVPIIKQTIALTKQPNAIAVFHDFLNREAVMDRLAEYDAFVGMKLHATVLACCAGTPSIMMEYRPKCRDFMNSIGMDEWVIRTDDAEPRMLRDRLDALCSQGQNLQTRLHDRCMTYKRLLIAEGQQVAELLAVECI
jgi:polysaccharide pyruvyl transferase WcaK-like protein